jgi:hypothetical protein
MDISEIFLSNKLDLGPNSNKCDTQGMKVRVHRSLTSRGANMIGGGYKPTVTPGKLKGCRKSINEMVKTPNIKTINKVTNKQLSYV